jgi:riboflavin kinase/FMN adenylyltransferase
MLHLSSLQDLRASDAWVTIGSFDGVHLGHQSIIRNMIAGAHSNNAPAFVITFHPHPAVFLRKIQEAYYLTSPEERAELLTGLGVDGVITLPFNQELADLSARDFISDLVSTTHMKHLWVGYDFALGRDRQGTVDVLQNLGEEFSYQLHPFQPKKINGKIISSSQIRQWVAAGELQKAARWLGRLYSVSGKVIHGDGRGRKIGIPTANLEIWPEKRLPAPGVYAAWTWIGEQCKPSVLNLGYRPTFSATATEPRLEVHIIDFKADLYNQSIRLDLVKRLRSEQRFPSVELLLAQIQQDIQETREVLKNVP